jgi:hypothetical protein
VIVDMVGPSVSELLPSARWHEHPGCADPVETP